MKERVLRVGIDDAPPIPMQSGDPAEGTFCGYEVDLLEILAERLNCKLEYRRAWWSLITKELETGRLDLVCSAATVTEQRETEVNFCEPYLRLKLALVTRQGVSASSLGLQTRFGVRRGTTAEVYLRSVLRREPASLSESNTELYEALASGKIDAVIDDSPIARAFVAAVPNLSYQGAYEGTDAVYAIMLAKGNDALKWELNTAISMLEAEGILASLRLHWFGTKELCIA